MNHLSNDRGVVSLLTATFFSLLVMIITIGTLVAQARELRQSTDIDQSTRSYFAAQAAIESVIRQVKATTPTNTTNGCVTPASLGITLPEFPADSGLEVTCLVIANGDIVLEGTGGDALKQEQSVQANLHNRDVRLMHLEWYSRPPGGLPYLSSGLYGTMALPNSGSWNLPPLMEVTAFRYPKGSFRFDEIESQTILLRPFRNGGTTADIGNTSVVQSVNCDQGGNLACKVDIEGFDPTNYNYTVRFRPRYSGDVSYLASFSGCAGCPPTTVNEGRIRIEITARAGDIFRRLVAYTSERAAPFRLGLDYVILPEFDICKNVQIDSNGTLTGNLAKSNRCTYTGQDDIEPEGPDEPDDPDEDGQEIGGENPE